MNKEFSSPPEVVFQSYYPSIDGFRAISILAVIFSHFFFNSGFWLTKIISGDWGVHFFFVISGFLITTLLLKEKHRKGEISLKHFYIRRFLRIFPVAYLFLLVLVLLSKVLNFYIAQNGIVSSALYIRNLPLMNSNDWYTGHYWSLSVEEQFYILFPWLLKKNLRIYLIIAVILILLAPILNYLYFHGFSESMLVELIYRLIVNQTGIMIGSVTAILFFYKKLKIPVFSGIICLILIFISMIIKSDLLLFIPSSLSPIVSSLVLSILLISSIQNNGGWFFWLTNNKIIVEIGVLSYSIYIWQQLFTHNQLWANYHSLFQTIIFNVISLGIISYISYYFFEKKFLIIKNKFK